MTSITAFILWDLSAGWLWFAGVGTSELALSSAAGLLSKHTKHKHKHKSTPLSSSSVHIELIVIKCLTGLNIFLYLHKAACDYFSFKEKEPTITRL